MKTKQKTNGKGIGTDIHPDMQQEIAAVIKHLSYDRQLKELFPAGVFLGDAAHLPIGCRAIGIPKLDAILGGGLPQGRIVEIYGPEASGKTTLALHAIAEVQKAGGIAAFIDAEHAFNVEYARAIGVRTDQLLVAQPDSGEAALELVNCLVASGKVALVVVDSVAALVPLEQLKAEMEHSLSGLHSRLMSKALGRLVNQLNATRSNCTVLFINQLRYKLGVVYGNPETTTGGNALKYYASIRLEVRRIMTLKRGNDEYGITIKVKTAKNKIVAPFRSVELKLVFGKGIES
ncbi:MAG: recombinase RecA [Leptolyngbyaceae cyanobacterium bins.302]|nr:recombinase RecA [Leptolyngbyaceae cyanobacterium bins.302]